MYACGIELFRLTGELYPLVGIWKNIYPPGETNIRYATSYPIEDILKTTNNTQSKSLN